MPPFWLIGIIARTGLAQRFQKAAAWIVAALFFALVAGLLIFGFRSWLHGREQQAVEVDRKDVTIEAANRVINATTAADANKAQRDDAFANQQTELRDEAHDKGTAADVGPGTRSVLERMRSQQQAGHRDTAR